MNINLNNTRQQFLQEELYFCEQRMHAPGLSLLSDNMIFINKNKVKGDLQTDPYSLICVLNALFFSLKMLPALHILETTSKPLLFTIRLKRKCHSLRIRFH